MLDWFFSALTPKKNETHTHINHAIIPENHLTGTEPWVFSTPKNDPKFANGEGSQMHCGHGNEGWNPQAVLVRAWSSTDLVSSPHLLHKYSPNSMVFIAWSNCFMIAPAFLSIALTLGRNPHMG